MPRRQQHIQHHGSHEQQRLLHSIIIVEVRVMFSAIVYTLEMRWGHAQTSGEKQALSWVA